MYRMSGDDTGLSSKAIALKDFTGMSVEEAQKEIDTLNKENEWNISLNTKEHIFDSDDKKNGTIYSQSVKPSTDLTSKTGLDEIEDLKKNKEGKIEGTIKCTVYSSEKIYYSEIRGMNAYALAEKLGIDKSDTSHFQGIKENGGSYYDLKNIQTKEGSISVEELKDESKAEKELSIDENVCITYYASDFFYWESLDSFVDKNINDIKCDTYQYDLNNEKKRKKTGKKESLAKTSLVSDDCYSFIKDAEIVVMQTVAEGEKLDTSKGMKGALLYEVREKLTFAGKTGDQVKKEIENKTKGWEDIIVNIEGGKEQESRKVIDVKIYDSEGARVNYFRKGEKFSITVTTEPIPESEAVPPSETVPNTPASSTPSYTPPTGGGNSGGGSDVGH